MRSMQRDKRNALATFGGTYDIRRTMFVEYQRKLREAREKRSAHPCTRDAVSSSMVELMTPSTPECDSAHTEVFA